MRVIAGIARGVPLVTPRDRGTRPITDRVKETLFGILAERTVDAWVIDLYAGSGAIGIEALSRGAVHCTFVERGRVALGSLRANLERTHLAGAATVVDGDVLRLLEMAPAHRYGLAFVDPPYAEHAILAPLERLLPHLTEGAMVVVKHFWRTEVPAPAGLRRWRERRFGETMLTFLQTDGAAEP
ncbi:MAG TPA: 16S rRNA (guanine(966)-N(2))-methyltransferase RsmD [Candidatus Limnocylindria bacterium]|nr:16S rRNA (guanine(966)-N(2))-methyltransferase RsmD [Candidatus Limnocylindria bacterium]